MLLFLWLWLHWLSRMTLDWTAVRSDVFVRGSLTQILVILVIPIKTESLLVGSRSVLSKTNCLSLYIDNTAICPSSQI